MNYTRSGTEHRLTLEKGELLTLVALVHEGLDSLRRKAATDEVLLQAKYRDADLFVRDLNTKIMRA